MRTSSNVIDASFESTGQALRKNRVFIVDDHPIFRIGLKRLVNAEEDLEVCGEAESVAQATELLRRISADAIIVDISLPGANGINLVKHLREECPHLPILVISAHDEQLYAQRALRAGAAGYLMKRENSELFLAALRKVLAGEIWERNGFGERAGAATQGAEARLNVLSDRELEILQLVGEGSASLEIAEALQLSARTVECHRKNIKEKLGYKNATELVCFAMDWVAQQRER